MISPNQEQHLGKISYLLFIVRNIAPGVFILLLSLVLFLTRHFIEIWAQSLLTTSVETSQIYLGVRIFTLLIFLIGAVATLIGFLVAYLQYTHYTFTIEEFGLKLKKGIFSTSELSIPYRQMQGVNIERSLFYRLVGLARVIVESAGNEEENEGNETEIILDPLDKTAAEEIRLLLQRKIGVQIVQSEHIADKEMAI